MNTSKRKHEVLHLLHVDAEDPSDGHQEFCLRWPDDVGVGGPLPLWVVDKIVGMRYVGSPAYVNGLDRLRSLERTIAYDPFLHNFDTAVREHVQDETWWGMVRAYFVLVEDCLSPQAEPGHLEPMMFDGLYAALCMVLFSHAAGTGRGTLAHLARVPREGAMFRDIRIWRDLEIPRNKWARERYPEEHHLVMPTFYDLLQKWMYDPTSM